MYDMFNETHALSGATEYDTFGVPEDFPSLVDSVAESLKDGYQDYCFSYKQVKQIISTCRQNNVSFVYSVSINPDTDEVEYYKLTPVEFRCGNKKLSNIQLEDTRVPVGYTYARLRPIHGMSIEKTDDANYDPRVCQKKYRIKHFDDSGAPVWELKRPWNKDRAQKVETEMKDYDRILELTRKMEQDYAEYMAKKKLENASKRHIIL